MAGLRFVCSTAAAPAVLAAAFRLWGELLELDRDDVDVDVLDALDGFGSVVEEHVTFQEVA